MLKQLLITLSFISIGALSATHKISGYTFYEAGLTPMAPYTFIFNREGQLVYLNKGLDQTFARAIKKNAPLIQTETIKADLAKVIDLPLFNLHDFTLITTTIDGKCEPCDKQLALFDEILPKLTPLKFHRITIELDPNRSQ